MSESWVEKHRPESWSDIQGNNSALSDIREWAEGWSEGDPAQLLVGPPGVGKTTTALVAADEIGVPIQEVNASDSRRKEDIQPIIREVRTSPVDTDHKLVLLDEVDNFHSSSTLRDLYKVIREAPNPLILTANDDYEVPSPIKRASDTHKFKLGVRSRKAKLKDIAEREGIDLSDEQLVELGERPDLRSAINDLQNTGGTEIAEDRRTWSDGEFDAVGALLSGDGEAWKAALDVESETFDRIDSALLWADENLKTEWRGLEAGVGYDVLSRADKWLPQAREQDYHYQVYSWALLSMLPETRLSEPYSGYIPQSFPEWFRGTTDTADGNSAEAQVFQALKDERGYQLGMGYYEFKTQALPILRDLPDDERRQYALDHGVPEDGLSALDLDPDDFEEWATPENAEAGESWTPDSNSASDW